MADVIFNEGLHYYLDRANVSDSISFDPVVKTAQTYHRSDFALCNPGTVLVPVVDVITSGPEACDGHTFFHDYYNQVHKVPGAFDFGTFLVDTSISVILFNAFLTKIRINSVVEVGINGETDGLTLSGIASYPYILEPLTYVNLSVLALRENVNDSFNGEYLFDIDALDSDGLTVIENLTVSVGVQGTRSTLFVYSPFKGITHSLAFKTRIAESYNGEQRAALIGRPYEEIRMQYRYPFGDAFAHTFFARARAGLPTAVPMWNDYAEVSDILIDQTIIPLPLKGTSFEVGKKVLLWDGDERTEIMEIANLDYDLDQLTFTEGAKANYQQAFLVPLRTGYAEKGVKLTNMANGYTKADVHYMLSDPHPAITDDDPLTYVRGRPLLDERNFQESSDEEYGAEFEKYEAAAYGRRFFLDRGFEFYQRDFVWRCFDRTSLNKLRYFLFAIKGKMKSFYVPSWMPDLQMAEDAPAASANIVMEHPPTDIAEDLEGKLLAFVGHDFSLRVVEVGSTTPTPSGLQLNLTQALSEDLLMADVRMVSHLELMRSNADRFELNYTDNEDITCKLKLLRVTDDE